MKRTIFLSLGLLLLAGTVGATTDIDIDFPIAELGNCANEDACYTYCEEPKNFEACYAFGTANGLVEEETVPPELIATLAAGGGPGGCTSQISCEVYCSDANHLVECVTFAEDSGLMSGEELEEAKKVMAAVQAGATLPGGCTSKDACESFCQNPSNMEECLAFAEVAGFMSSEELEQARKILPLMQSGQTPGGCTSEKTCKAYCESGDHLEECLDFGVKTGFMTPEEADQIKASGAGMMGGGPGGCKSEKECMAYCQNPANQEECKQFGGGSTKMMEGEFDEKGFGTEFTGPGGCKSEKECMVYCQANPGACSGMGPQGAQEENQENEQGDFIKPSGCSSPEECMNLFGGTTGEFEEMIKSEDDGRPDQWDGDEFNKIEPQFEVSPDSLFITPPSNIPSGEFGDESSGSGSGSGDEPHSLSNRPNATFVENAKKFLFQ